MALSMQVWPPVEKERESLQYLISRINEQRGSFRQVSEQSLKQEIQLADDGGTADVDGRQGEDLDLVDDAEGELELLHKRREQVIKHVQQAHNESAAALEFVSLLLSKHIPAAATLTMSPFLKQKVPIGALGAETVKAPKASDLDKQMSARDRQTISLGWRTQSLTSTADLLVRSARRLEEEIRQETTYWGSILSVKDEGWSLCRMPSERHTLGVRYGFAEAHADFRDRGLAALRPDNNGHLSLDRAAKSVSYQRLQIRYLQKGTVVACSTNGSTQTRNHDSIASQILQARDSIFDEELHLEIHREARSLLNRDVRCQDGCVLLPYGSRSQIEIDLVDVETAPLQVDASSQEDIMITPDALLLLLRISLSAAHHRKLQDRSRIPQPLRETPLPRPIYAILTPIVECLSEKRSPLAILATLSQNG